MLLERVLKVPHLLLDDLGELEDPPGQERPVLAQDDLEERARNPGGVRYHVVLDKI